MRDSVRTVGPGQELGRRHAAELARAGMLPCWKRGRRARAAALGFERSVELGAVESQALPLRSISSVSSIGNPYV